MLSQEEIKSIEPSKKLVLEPSIIPRVIDNKTGKIQFKIKYLDLTF